MSAIDLLSSLATLAFAGVFIGCSVLASSGLSLENRANLLERRDPGAAAALRRAQTLHDFSYIGMFGDEAFGVVCTPDRRSSLDMARIRASEADFRVEPPEEALPPVPATVTRDGSTIRVSPRDA